MSGGYFDYKQYDKTGDISIKNIDNFPLKKFKNIDNFPLNLAEFKRSGLRDGLKSFKLKKTNSSKKNKKSYITNDNDILRKLQNIRKSTYDEDDYDDYDNYDYFKISPKKPSPKKRGSPKKSQKKRGSPKKSPKKRGSPKKSVLNSIVGQKYSLKKVNNKKYSPTKIEQSNFMKNIKYIPPPIYNDNDMEWNFGFLV